MYPISYCGVEHPREQQTMSMDFQAVTMLQTSMNSICVPTFASLDRKRIIIANDMTP